jgi:hypothetical protein
MSHERAFELLPWLVNETLAPDARDLVEQHVRTCLSCHRELKEQQRLRAALRSQPAVHVSSQSGFDELTRRLNGTPAIRDRRRPFAALASFAVVGTAGVALLGMLFWLASGPGANRSAPDFQTLATPPPDAATAIDVVFAQSITAADLERLLAEIDGSIASGPSALGRYTVRLDDAYAGTDVDALLVRLQKDPRVRFAGRTLAAQASQ